MGGIFAGLFSALGNVHGHDAGPVEDDTAAAGDDALDGLTGLRMFFERVIVHRLHDFEALGFLSFFLGKCLVKISRHGRFWFGGVYDLSRVEARIGMGLPSELFQA